MTDLWKTLLADRSGRVPGSPGRSPQTAPARDVLVVVLTLTTGAVDAVTFVRLGHVFSSVITGNLTLLGVAAGERRGGLAVNGGLALAGYGCGVLIGGVFAKTPADGQPAWPCEVTTTLTAELVVLAGFCAGWLAVGGHPSGGGRLALLAVAAAAMGMQATAVRRLGQMSTTYLTSTLTGLLQALAIRRWPPEWQRSTGVLVAMVTGAAAGAVAAILSPAWVPAAVGVPLAVVLTASWSASPPPETGAGSRPAGPGGSAGLRPGGAGRGMSCGVRNGSGQGRVPGISLTRPWFPGGAREFSCFGRRPPGSQRAVRNVLAVRLAGPGDLLTAVPAVPPVPALVAGAALVAPARREAARRREMSGSAAHAAAILGDIMVLAWARRLLRTFRESHPRSATYTYRSDLSALRAVVREHAQRAGLPPLRVGDLVLAVSEVAANTLRYTRSPGTLAIWHNADEIVCEMRDEGVIADPLAGRRPPAPDALSGHGLWLVHQVCDGVELRSCASGTVVRMRMAVHEQQGSCLASSPAGRCGTTREWIPR